MYVNGFDVIPIQVHIKKLTQNFRSKGISSIIARLGNIKSICKM